MRFPLALTSKIAASIITQKLRRTPNSPRSSSWSRCTPANLTYTGCGLIREYSTSLKDILPLEDCLALAED